MSTISSFTNKARSSSVFLYFGCLPILFIRGKQKRKHKNKKYYRLANFAFLYFLKLFMLFSQKLLSLKTIGFFYTSASWYTKSLSIKPFFTTKRKNFRFFKFWILQCYVQFLPEVVALCGLSLFNYYYYSFFACNSLYYAFKKLVINKCVKKNFFFVFTKLFCFINLDLPVDSGMNLPCTSNFAKNFSQNLQINTMFFLNLLIFFEFYKNTIYLMQQNLSHINLFF